jgi:hypothetical protein
MSNDESVRLGWIGFSEADDGNGQRVGDNAFHLALSTVCHPVAKRRRISYRLPIFPDYQPPPLSVPSVNRVDGISEIEGKAAKGSGERVGKGASLKSVVLLF